MKKQALVSISLLLLVLLAGGCDGWPAGGGNNGALLVSGTVAIREVQVSPEVGGRVVEVRVEEGSTVPAGEVLLRLDDELLRAQHKQAVAAVAAAEATVEAARAQYESARLQYEAVLEGARLQEMSARSLAWQSPVPDEFDLPVWYFARVEAIEAARVELAAAQAALRVEQADLQNTLRQASNADFVAVERRLAEAQAALLVAQTTREQAAAGDIDLERFAQQQYDAALAELSAAQLAYDRQLSDAAARDLREARARHAIAQARYDNAADRLSLLRTGSESLQVEAAAASMGLAETAIAQAEAQLAQARAAEQLIALQMDRTVVRAPIGGTVLARNVEVGELAAPGSVLLVLGQLDEVRVTVYIPETRYGQVSLGQAAQVTADSFPGQTFAGTVVRISDRAEFTPRNVQTAEGRRSTVYAAEILVPNPEQRLKPGMPVDVEVK